jgi:predicted NBD/HSP70 family sugar kinase
MAAAGARNTVHSRTIRKLNTARVFQAIRQRPGVSQSKLLGLTGIDRSTISTIVQQLEEDGIVLRSKSAERAGLGRPGESLSINADAGSLVGIAVEPGRVLLALTGLDGVVRMRHEQPTPADARLQLEALRSAYSTLLEKGEERSSVLGVGLTLRAARTGTTAHIDAGGASYGKRIAEDVEGFAMRPVSFSDDVHAYAWAEHQFGVARGVDNFLFVSADSGVCAALFLDGRLRQGDGLAANGMGHTKVELDGRLCSCGARGCLQAYVSAEAILTRLSEFKHPTRNVKEIISSAQNNDALVRTVLSEAGSYLGFALANAINMIGVREVVLAGDLASLSDHLAPALRKMLRDNVLGGGDNVVLRKSFMGSDGPIFGAIALAMHAFLPGPIDLVERLTTADLA